MTKADLIAAIGPVVQVAFVPEDFDDALAHWTNTMGIGPFFWIEHAGLVNATFEGQPSDVDFGLALAYWGDIQVELIKQHNTAPSIYNTAPYATSGLHHICLITDDIADARTKADASNARRVVEAELPGGGAVFYAETRSGEPLVEVLQSPPGSDGLFDMIKSAAVGWDGSDPLRPLGQSDQ
ncbi:MAG: VOC family protein [Pseudomonadota bacterium]